MFWGRNLKKEIHISQYKNLKEVKRSSLDVYSLQTYVFKKTEEEYTSLEDKLKRRMFHQLIDKLNENEVIVWNASEEFFNKIWINFYNEDVITDYLPAARCPSYNPVIKLFNYSEYFELWEYINNQLRLKSVILKRKNNKIEVYSVFSEILKIFCFDDKREVVETLTKEMNEVWKIDDCVCRPTKLHVFSSKFTYLHFLLKSKLCLIKQINDVKIDNHEWFSEGMEMLRSLIEKIPKT